VHQRQVRDYQDAAHFEADCEKAFTKKVREAVARQSYETIANWQGVMMGDGEVWFAGVCGNATCDQQTVKIIAVND